MNKTLDDFSKNLAGGMSRRRAFLKLLAGTGAFGFLGARRAKAGAKLPKFPPFPKDTASCGSVCLNWAGEVYDLCLLSHPKDSNFCFSDVLGPAYDECVFACTHQEADECW
jgi:hypothetical protein